MKDYKIVKEDKIEYLQFNRLVEYSDKLVHAIFLKHHDIGFDLYKNLHVRDNSIAQIRNTLGINGSIIQSKQIHSSNIKVLTNETEDLILDGYDGYITDKPNITTITTFADCIPIFLYDPRNNVYANIHSGWRGVINQISLKAIDMLIKDYNSNISDIICCIGPNIAKECFLVNEDVVELYKNTFSRQIKENTIIEETELSNEKGKQYRIDNNLLLELLIIQHGLLTKNVINSNICTVCQSNDFHSRRAEGENFQKGGGLMMLR